MKTPKPVCSDRTKANKRARVIARIRGFANPEAESSNWVCVRKPTGEESDSVTLSLGDQSSSRRECYELDYCYERNEGSDTIFSKEVKPLISGVFDGLNATVIACGAKGSGKTSTIQGSDKEPGLAALAIAEFLSMSQEIGKSITISFYEIVQDHVHDLLDPKRPEVQVLDGGQGKIQLKGLSRVPVKSISEFQTLYIERNSQKPVQKIIMELPHRSHKGLIVHVSSVSDALPVGKMNFVDLAGYEDTRRKTNEGLNHVDNTKINKSIYAVHNVVYALNAKENHVPYRESKLTRVLQDSLGGKSRILMITCLNPSICQDSMYMVSLASRACQGLSQTVSETAKKHKISARSLLLSSLKSQLPRSVSSTKKHIGSQMHSYTKKVNSLASVMKGRKLFDEASQLTKPEKTPFEIKGRKLFDEASQLTKPKKTNEKVSSSSNVVSTISSFVPEQEGSKMEKALTSPVDKENYVHDAMMDKDSTLAVDASPSATINLEDTADFFLHMDDNQGKVTPSINSDLKMLSIDEESQNINKENNHSLVNKDESPPISERLQKLMDDLKQLNSSTPLCRELPPKTDTSSIIQACTNIEEPKTPDQNKLLYNKCEFANMKSPWETYSAHGSGVKNSLVQEYLRLLNTGSKEDLQRLKGIGEKRATYILKLREESPEYFKNLDDLKDVGLSAKQIKGMMKKEVGDLFN